MGAETMAQGEGLGRKVIQVTTITEFDDGTKEETLTADVEGVNHTRTFISQPGGREIMKITDVFPDGRKRIIECLRHPDGYLASSEKTVYPDGREEGVVAHQAKGVFTMGAGRRKHKDAPPILSPEELAHVTDFLMLDVQGPSPGKSSTPQEKK